MAHYLVIAASSSIGQAVTNALKAQGDSVFTTARDKTKITPEVIPPFLADIKSRGLSHQ